MSDEPCTCGHDKANHTGRIGMPDHSCSFYGCMCLAFEAPPCPMEDVNGYCRECDHFTECFDVLADLVGPDEEEEE